MRKTRIVGHVSPELAAQIEAARLDGESQSETIGRLCQRGLESIYLASVAASSAATARRIDELASRSEQAANANAEALATLAGAIVDAISGQREQLDLTTKQVTEAAEGTRASMGRLVEKLNQILATR